MSLTPSNTLTQDPTSPPASATPPSEIGTHISFTYPNTKEVTEDNDDITTCIVCLVDLPETSSDTAVGDSSDQIARLVPCNHAMHNSCLAPWVERANSCPICRQCFNQVRLHNALSGPIISEYSVEDRIQKPDCNRNFPIDFRCLLCDESSVEEEIIDFVACDSCHGSFHTTCCKLDGPPQGTWFCPLCLGTAYDSPTGPFIGVDRRAGRRYNFLTRLPANHRVWAGVWQDVWAHLNRDLDEEDEDDQDTEDVSERREAQRRQWDRRVEIAQAQGGRAVAFRAVAPYVVSGYSRPLERIFTDGPESQEDQEAWEALKDFKALENGATEIPDRKRRSSAIEASEGQANPQPERKLKRPRTRPDAKLTNLSTNTSSSPPAVSSIPQPSVFGSWLNKLGSQGESSDHHGGVRHYPTPRMMSISPTRSGPQSPILAAVSPASPPWSRPHSPHAISLHRPAFSPSPSQSPGPASPLGSRPQRRPVSPDITPSTSPTRTQLALPVKEEIQAIVRCALRPHYKASKLNTEQYTEINKNISRHLYEIVGSRQAGLSTYLTEGEDERLALVKLAETEVEIAISRIAN